MQKKVRHVRRVIVRNLVVDAAPSPIDCYYTLSADPTSKPYYTSDVSLSTLNPSWDEIPMKMLSEEQPGIGMMDVFFIRVMGKKEGGEDVVLLEEKVRLDETELIHSLERSSLPRMPPNAVLLFLTDGIHALPQKLKSKTNSLGTPVTFVDRGAVLKTSSDEILHGLGQILSLQAQITDVKTQTDKVCEQLTEEIKTRSEIDNANRSAELRKQTRAELMKLCEQESAKLKKEKDRVREQRRKAIPRSALLQSMFEQLIVHRHKIKEISERMEKVEGPRAKDLDVKVGTRRRKQLYELSRIYTLDRRRLKNQSNCMFIRDVTLQHTLEGGPADDDQVATALGYVCHVLLMLSKILDIPLRYRIVYHASRSIICDDIHSWEYPLSLQSGQEPRFRWGRKLLNRNIEHLLSLRCANWSKAMKRNGDDDDSNMLENLQQLFNEAIHSNKHI